MKIKNEWKVDLDSFKNTLDVKLNKEWVYENFGRAAIVGISNSDDFNINIIISEEEVIKAFENNKLDDVIKKCAQDFFENQKIVNFIALEDALKIDSKTKNLNNLDLKIHDTNINKDVKHSAFQQKSTIINNWNNLVNSFTFENFVKCDYNEVAFDIWEQIKEGIYYNPIFITSNSGLGKTHFLNAIGSELMQLGKKVQYIHTDILTREFTSLSFTNNSQKITELVDYLINLDVLLIDDIQNLADRVKTVGILFNLINTWSNDPNKLLIITSDRSPEELGGFEERMITRFHSGLTIEFKKPSFEDLEKIIKFKIQEEKLNPEQWDEEAINFIIKYMGGSIRQLNGGLNKVKFYTKSNPKLKENGYTLQVISNIFKNIKTGENLTYEAIINSVCSYYSISKTDIIGKSRRKDVVLARDIAIWSIKEKLKMNLVKIGTIFSNRDHSTIISSINRIQKRLNDDPNVKVVLNRLSKKFQE